MGDPSPMDSVAATMLPPVVGTLLAVVTVMPAATFVAVMVIVVPIADVAVMALPIVPRSLVPPVAPPYHQHGQQQQQYDPSDVHGVASGCR